MHFRFNRFSRLIAASALAAVAIAASGCSKGTSGAGGPTAVPTSTATPVRSPAGDPVSSFVHIHGLALPAWAPDRLYVSTHEGLILVNEVGDWRFLGSKNQRHDFMGFQAHPTEKNTLYSSGHPALGTNLPNPLGFIVSNDGGLTWRMVALQGNADFHATAVSPSDGRIIYGWSASGAIYRSLDGGKQWEKRPAQALNGVIVLSLSVHPQDSGQVYAGTMDGLWRSADGGATWDQAFAGVPVSAVAFVPQGKGDAIAYLADGKTGLVSMPDGAVTRTALGLNLGQDDAVVHIAMHPSGSGVMYLGTGKATLIKTTDGAKTFETFARDGKPLKG